MHLRVRGHFDLESVAVLLADKADQLVGVVELARRRCAHRRRRQIAAQRHDALHSRLAIALELRRHMRARRANAGQVRRDFDAGVLHHRQQRLVGAFLIRAARAVRDRKNSPAAPPPVARSSPAAWPRPPASAAETTRTKKLAAISFMRHPVIAAIKLKPHPFSQRARKRMGQRAPC